MKAAVVETAGHTPVYTDFPDPTPEAGYEIVTMRAAALTHLTKGRAAGTHYSAEGELPMVVGVDGVGVTEDGRRVYFALPEAPYGAMAEKAKVRSSQCIPVPDGLDDITAAALANPGMSAWAAFAERARLIAGETVLVNGATGSAGRIAVQIAKYIGAAKVIATGRDANALEQLKAIGADIVIPLQLDAPDGAKAFEQALKQEFAKGIDVVVDYLWGDSAVAILTAIVKGVEDAHPVRFVQVGSVSGDSIQLPGAALRSSSVVLMGSGLKSVRLPALLGAIRNVFEAAVEADLQLAVKTVKLPLVERTWNDRAKERIVFVMM